jgi:hypothetical protein
MSEGVFLAPNIRPATDPNSCKQYALTTAFGTAGAVLVAKAGRLYKAQFTNKHATTAFYVQLFNKATAPVNTDTCIWEVRIPAAGTAEGGSAELDFGVAGLYFGAGISFAFSSTQGVLTLPASADGTAYALYTATTT